MAPGFRAERPKTAAREPNGRRGRPVSENGRRLCRNNRYKFAKRPAARVPAEALGSVR
jgi:hypothetical protein